MEAYKDIRPSTSQPRLHLASTFDPGPGQDYILDLRPSCHFTFRPSTMVILAVVHAHPGQTARYPEEQGFRYALVSR